MDQPDGYAVVNEDTMKVWRGRKGKRAQFHVGIGNAHNALNEALDTGGKYMLVKFNFEAME